MRAYVYGGGPSLREWTQRGSCFTLMGSLEISCNGHLPDALVQQQRATRVILSADRTWWREQEQRSQWRGAMGVWVDHDEAPRASWPKGVLRVRGAGQLWEHAWSDDLADGLMVGGCSGIPALHFAVLAGATEVHLVGIDLAGPGLAESTWERTRAAFAYAVEQARARGVEVVSHGRWKP